MVVDRCLEDGERERERERETETGLPMEFLKQHGIY